MDRDSDFLLEGGDQLLGRIGLEQTCHILDGQHMGAAVLQLLGHIHIVFQGVFVIVGIQNIAGVADCSLQDLVLVEDFIHGDLHAFDPVEGVEYTEDVDAAACSCLDELADQVVGIVGVADSIGAAQQHLQQEIGRFFTDDIQTLPGRLVQETVGNIKGGAAPALQGEGVGQDLGGAVHTLYDITGADTGAQQGLVGVAAGGVGDEQLFLLPDPLCDLFGSLGVQHLLETHLAVSGHGREAGDLIEFVHVVLGDGALRNVSEHLGGPVLTALDLEEGRSLVDELGVALAGLEGLVLQDVGDEGDIGLDAPDVHFTDGTKSLVADALEGAVPGSDLDQQGIVVRGDDGAGAGGRLVHTDTKAAGDAVAGDPARVGRKVVGGILGGDTALNGKTVEFEVFLLCDANAGIGEGLALSDQDLGAHQVYAGDHLGDRVLDLNAGIHLDKIVVFILVDQELQSSCIGISDMLCDRDSVAVKFFLDFLGNRESGSELDNFLIASLQGAVTLKQMCHISVLIGQDLDFDVLGIDQEFLHEDVAVAEGLECFGFDQVKVDADFFDSIAASHASSAAAGSCFENDRETEFHRQLLGFFTALERLLGSGSGRYIAVQRHLLGTELVAHHIQDLGSGSDEFDAGLFAGAREITVFGKKSVSGVDRVTLMHDRQLDDPGDVQISAERAFILADQVRLIRCRTESRVSILIGIDRNSLQAKIVTGAEDTHRDLTAVCNQDFFKLRHCPSLLISTITSGTADSDKRRCESLSAMYAAGEYTGARLSSRHIPCDAISEIRSAKKQPPQQIFRIMDRTTAHRMRSSVCRKPTLHHKSNYTP